MKPRGGPLLRGVFGGLSLVVRLLDRRVDLLLCPRLDFLGLFRLLGGGGAGARACRAHIRQPAACQQQRGCRSDERPVHATSSGLSRTTPASTSVTLGCNDAFAVLLQGCFWWVGG